MKMSITLKPVTLFFKTSHVFKTGQSCFQSLIYISKVGNKFSFAQSSNCTFLQGVASISRLANQPYFSKQTMFSKQANYVCEA